ncbi:hypothetical protein [Nostoc sphaeroides]|uniref:Uncharacterized protein n=1 Tax=Nostoc sphaeroides CCNUC1 TaxID=2653204 RepID=A0A5P8VV25_9NOSO|nr:hypothetical protein [Nostoc sphaeroides]QFS44235.1 hypothetical protein GXM_01708 [Nostoc sphaeroides CCNUC1]
MDFMVPGLRENKLGRQYYSLKATDAMNRKATDAMNRRLYKRLIIVETAIYRVFEPRQ